MPASNLSKRYQVIVIPLIFLYPFQISYMKNEVFSLKRYNWNISFSPVPAIHVQFPHAQEDGDWRPFYISDTEYLDSLTEIQIGY